MYSKDKAVVIKNVHFLSHSRLKRSAHLFGHPDFDYSETDFLILAKFFIESICSMFFLIFRFGTKICEVMLIGNMLLLGRLKIKGIPMKPNTILTAIILFNESNK